ncbi:MAG: hypothetical protein ACMXYB_00320 [Candidatus Woesearchaeota archaeon]
MPIVIRCLHCQEFQMSTAQKIVKCIKCYKSMQKENLKIFFQSDSPQACTEVVKRLKEEYFRVHGNYGEDDFFTYELNK